MAAQDRQCPSCGAVVPAAEGQHAENLVSDQVRCPSCGEKVLLETDARGDQTGDVARAEGAPPGRREEGGFSGQEDLGDLADELHDKPT
jgi:DNA-directed RNA polymerase subunit RPC12/RpoP